MVLPVVSIWCVPGTPGPNRGVPPNTTLPTICRLVICSHTQAGPKNDPHTQRADAMTYYLLGELYVSVIGIILVRAGQNYSCHANI